MKKTYPAIAFIFTLLITLVSFGQNGTRLIAYDAKTAGRGGTSTGFFDNPSLMMNNPAGLSFLKSKEMDISMSLMAPTVRFRNSINDARGKDNLFPLGAISFVHTSQKKLTYAAGIFTQGGMGADLSLNHELYKYQSGGYMKQDYHSKFAVMQGGISVAYKLTNNLSMGVTANLVYGQVEFGMPMAMPPSMLKGVIDPQSGYTFGNMFSSSPELNGLGYSELVATAKMESLTSYNFNGKVGLAFKPNEKFSAGINYSLPVTMNYKNGTAKMDMSYQLNDAFAKIVAGIMSRAGATQAQAEQIAMDQFSQFGINLAQGVTDNYTAEVKFGLPQSISGGIYFAPLNKLRFAVDGEWINWANAFDQMDISLKGGTNPNINRMLGTVGTIEMAFPLNWKNTVVIRTGAEFDVSKNLTLRSGFVYGSNPVPNSTVFPVFPAVVQNHLTAGATTKLSRSLALNLAWEYAFRNDESVRGKSLVAGEYDYSTSSLTNSIYHASLSWYLK